MRSLTGATELLAVVGNPVSHSLSPLLQNHLIDRAGIDCVYVPLRVAQGRFGEFLASVRSIESFKGCNVTVPFKEDALRGMDVLSEEAAAVGAVNTVVVDGGVLKGYNSDVSGVDWTLRQELGLDVAGTKVAILGAGGAARSVARVLGEQGCRNVTVLVRDRGRAEPFAAWMKEACPGATVQDVRGSDGADAVRSAGLVVNTTPVGLHGEMPDVVRAMPEGAAFFDLCYAIGGTPAVRSARAKGMRAVDGLPMLVAQGVRSFELWSGIAFDVRDILRWIRERTGHGQDTDR